MERIQKSEVVKDVATKKKYVKPDFEVYELNWEAPLLSASGVEGTRQQYRTINNDWE